MAGKCDLIILQGSTFTRVIQWLEDDGVIPIPLTGYSARAQIRETYESTIPIVSLTSASGGGLVINEALGKITLTIIATVTAALSFPLAVWDLEIVSSDAVPVVTRLLQGNVRLSPEVSR